MAHIALYRTWRPQAFRDVVGQKHIIQTLQNSLREGRISHAYLFNGPRGTGKTSAAKILAKAVNCQRGPSVEPCNECDACRRITEGAVMDVLEIDAASNRGVEEIRDIRDKVKYAPTEVRHKVYIIDEVHMLTTEAFNALLKTLEEPPAHVMFILATTEPHKLPATIISRCQRFDFRRVSLDEQVERLDLVCRHEEIEAEPEALRYIARLSDGGMRDALSLLDQVIAFSGKRVCYADALSMTGGVASEQFERLAASIRDRDVATALGIIDDFMQDGKSADKCLEQLIHYFRDLLLVKMVPGSPAVTERILDAGRMRELAGTFTNEQMMHTIEVLNQYHVEMKYSAQPQTMFEVAVMKICSAPEAPGSAAGQAVQPQAADSAAGGSVIRDLTARLAQMEQQLAQLQKMTPAAGNAAAQAAPAAAPFRAAPSSAVAKRSGEKLDGYLAGKDSPELKTVFAKWGQVLGRVKEQKITVHAWLVDGEPVAAADGRILLAFKSVMHRETTEKPANKQLIEQVIADVYGQPYRLATAMLKDWKATADQAKQPAPKEEMQLVQEEAGKPAEQNWITEAIHLFGEDLVTIKED